jgi:iron complex outermembrane receptor protein
VFFITVDSQKAKFYGAEVEATALVGSSGQLDVSVTGLHARFDEFVVGSINNSGHEVQGAPDFTLNAGYQHTFDLAGGGQVRARLSGSYVDGHYLANNNARGSFQSAYTKTGVDVSFTSANHEWTVTAFGRNLENEAVIGSYADPISRGGDIAFLEAPRTYGVTVAWSLR